MAKGNNYQSFSQVDYCIRQYFSKYMASTIEQETKKLKDGQTMDDMMSNCKARWNRDGKLKRDTQTFADAFYKCLVARNGGKQSKELRAYALAYVNNRYESLTVEQLARKKVPSNSAEYIAKKAFDESWICSFSTGAYKLATSKNDKLGDKIKEKAEELYNPSTLELAAGYAGGFAIDSAITGGAGLGVKAVTKGASVAAAKAATKLSAKSVTKNLAVNASIAGGTHYLEKQAAGLDDKEFGEEVFGDEDALKKIQDGGLHYKKGGTEYINSINGHLNKKIKTPPLNTSAVIKKESNALLVEHKGNSSKLLNTIKTKFSQQAIPFNGNSKVPGWMLNNSAKQNRALAASFYACALEMSKNQQSSRKFGGKTMALKEVSQRAFDYARAATVVEHKQAALHKQAGFSTSTQKHIDKFDDEMAKLNAIIDGKPTTKHKAASSSRASAPSPQPSVDMSSSPYTQYAAQPSQPNQQTQQPNPMSSILQQNAGWGNALEQLGLNGFSDVTKNLGYVLAMLPDMLIGMFTGKNPNMKLEDNFMPLAAIVGGLFVKNPLLKMLLLGFGGANLFNNAGHAAITQGMAKTAKAVSYKTYPDEALNKRIVDPVMKGSSMVATIDGKPVVINISDNAVDAYERGNVPLNTLANAVLRKYDETNALASRNYDMQQKEESLEQQRGLK